MEVGKVVGIDTVSLMDLAIILILKPFVKIFQHLIIFDFLSELHLKNSLRIVLWKTSLYSFDKGRFALVFLHSFSKYWMKFHRDGYLELHSTHARRLFRVLRTSTPWSSKKDKIRSFRVFQHLLWGLCRIEPGKWNGGIGIH